MVINGEKSRFIPEDFSDFLLTKIEHFPKQRSPSVAAQNGMQFIRALDEELRRQFRTIIGELDVHIEQIHSPCANTVPNGFFGIFYRFFVQKHVANIINEDGNCKYLNKYAAIFPFPVSEELEQCDIDILEAIDDKLMAEMQTFLNKHFARVEIRPVCRKFFANILNCEQKNVPESAILAAVEGLDLKGLSGNCRGDGNFKKKLCFGNEECEYLKGYPRVNNTGVIRKRNFDTDQDVFCLENDNLRAVKNYFDNLPGIANALIDHEIHTELLGSHSLISNERVALNMHFRIKVYKPINEFYELIIYGALSPNSIERLVVYNAFSGEERSILMPSNKDAVLEFIRKYNKYDFSQTLPPEKFITWRFDECYYQGDSDDMESKTFPNGRHRNKTYHWVLENDKKLCQLVLRGEKSKYIPEDFFNFLSTKLEHFSISKPHYGDVNSFVKALDAEMRSQFRDIIGKFVVQTEQIHSPSVITVSNGFLGSFTRFFVRKHVANIRNTDGHREYVENCAAIFPFPISDELVRHDIHILNVIDDKLMAEMQTFLNEHFDRAEIGPVCRKFFANILNCRQKNVPEKTIVEAVKHLNLKGLPANNKDGKSSNDKSCFGNVKCEYLKTYPRVNDSGVSRHRKIYDMIVEVTKLYGKPCNVQAFKYQKDYLLKLPEINFYELYSLLNVDFLNSDRREYVYRFKKYLFFFINTLNNPSKPVFFIDDGLYECLLHYNTFKKSRDDVETLKFELSMLTLAHRRKQTFDVHRGNYCLDDNNLKNIKNYFDNFPDIANALPKHETPPGQLKGEGLVSTEQVKIDVCFRSKTTNVIADFFKYIMYGALSPNNIERLVIYNAFRGEETSILMPSNKQAIVEFVRKYNKYDFSQAQKPKNYHIWGQESYFRGDVANWDSKQKFRY
ncbi:hypothetical protein U1Q18_045920 [Sarracenia purpurea var. burkii]